MSRAQRTLAVLAASALASAGLMTAFAPAASAATLPPGCTASYSTTYPAPTTAKAGVLNYGDTVQMTVTEATPGDCTGVDVNNKITVTAKEYPAGMSAADITLQASSNGGTNWEAIKLTETAPGVFTGTWGPADGFPILVANDVANQTQFTAPAGKYSVDIQLYSATDAGDVDDVSAAMDFTLLAVPTTVASNTNLTVGGSAKPFSQTYSGNATLPQSTSFTYALNGSTLPTGVTFNSATGTFSADATAKPGATWIGAIEATDQLDQVGTSNQFTITVVAAPLTITGDADMWGVAGEPFSNTSVSASGGTPPYTFDWDIDPTDNPGFGLSINPDTGAITGTAGDYQLDEQVDIDVTDDAGANAVYTTTLHLLGFDVSGPSMSGDYIYCEAGQPFSVTFTPYGLGGHPGVFSSSQPVTSSGVTLTPSGTLSGTPTDCDFMNYAYTLTDTVDGRVFTQTFPDDEPQPTTPPSNQKTLADTGASQMPAVATVGLAALAMGLAAYVISRRLRADGRAN